MSVQVLHEAGYEEAMLGLSLSKNQDPADMPKVAHRLYNKDGGHNKFLESMKVWLLVTAPRYVWQQIDTYRVDVTKQSESTMHTLMKRPIEQDDFDEPIWPTTLVTLNGMRDRGEFNRLKNELPEGFLQKRQLCTSYATLRRMMKQRYNHRLPWWREFCLSVIEQLEYKEFFEDILGLIEESK
jgi:hypothetical protein